MGKKVSRESRRGDDWKQWRNGWKYKTDAPQNRQWNKDRKELFQKNGNGWWFDVGCATKYGEY